MGTRSTYRRSLSWGMAHLPQSGRARAQGAYGALGKAALRGRGFGIAEHTDSGETWVLDDLRTRRPDIATVVDVGANVGGWSLEVAARWPGATIHAFEPSAATFTALTRATAGRDGIRSVNVAVGHRAGFEELHAVPGLPGMTSLHQRDLAEHGLVMSETETVEVVTLDDFCAELGIDHIDLLKIDAEGHDLAVLQGAVGLLDSGRIDLVQFEFGGANIDSRTFLRDFVRLLEPRYELSRVVVDGLVPLRYAESEEIFVTTNFLARLSG